MTLKEGKYLHIYAQHDPHDAAVIVGNKLGLLELRQAIDEALKGIEYEATLTPSDGEGYEAYVVMLEDDEREKFESLEMPYVSQYGERNSHIYYVNGGDEDRPPKPVGSLWD